MSANELVNIKYDYECLNFVIQDSKLNWKQIAVLVYFFRNDIQAYLVHRLLNGELSLTSIQTWYTKFRDNISNYMDANPVVFGSDGNY